MSADLLTYVDRVVDASMKPAARAMEPVTRAVRSAVEDSDGYAEADAALRRLEDKVRADDLEGLIEEAMRLGTSAGSVE